MAKGRNTFERYQQARQERRERLIDQFLNQLQSSRVRFEHVTGLADMVAMHISHQEQHPCNKATLLRNKRYKALLLTFMAAHLGAGTKNLRLNDLTDDKSKALVTTAQLEAGNLRREVERLNAYIGYLEKRQAGEPPRDHPAHSSADVEKATRSLREAQLKHTRTCQALFAVLRHLSQALSADAEHQRIIDLSRLRNNVVVDAAIAGPFFEWLAANKDVG
ncbi:hypothetical protein [Paraburkholderia sp. MM6662-R1]|uniref:hypothetical protein n=1 Tax=Paraburkholderia sp. MM6662-R1 TaxID=2991066 RepID=UPI003D236072